MKLSLVQKAALPLINLLVERLFPEGCFYGRRYMDAFKRLDIEGEYVAGRTAAMYLQSIMRKSGADGIKIEMHEVTENGEPVGSFVLRLDRMPEDDK